MSSRVSLGGSRTRSFPSMIHAPFRKTGMRCCIVSTLLHRRCLQVSRNGGSETSAQGPSRRSERARGHDGKAVGKLDFSNELAMSDCTYLLEWKTPVDDSESCVHRAYSGSLE